MTNLRKILSGSLAALMLIICFGGITAYPAEAGETETSSPNVTTTDADCPGVPRRFYDELDCNPIFKNPQDRCPMRFTCESFEKSDAEMCYFHGESLAPGTMLNETGNPCDIDCRCELEGPYAEYNVTKMAVFRCAIVDCPLEEQSSYDENGELRKCVPKKSHDECCASETVCMDGDDESNTNDERDAKEEIGDAKSTDTNTSEKPKVQSKKLATCVTADNSTYIEGQEFYPDDLPCKVCICQPGYTAGESGEPWCRDIRCSSILANTRQIREGCTPVYYNTSRCCPIDFLCPNANDTVVTDVLIKIAPNPDETCKFGDLFFRPGDRLATRPDEKCIECECQIPPLLTCHQKADC